MVDLENLCMSTFLSTQLAVCEKPHTLKTFLLESFFGNFQVSEHFYNLLGLSRLKDCGVVYFEYFSPDEKALGKAMPESKSNPGILKLVLGSSFSGKLRPGGW